MVLTKFLIGDGRKARLWESNWIGGQSLKSLASNLYRHSKRKNCTVQDAMQQGRWINDIRHNLTIPLLDEFLWEVLARDTPQLTEEVQDLIVLRWTTDGEYSAKSAYQFQFNGMVLSPSTKLSWEEWASANCKIFSWLVLQNRVWTANQLQIRR